MSKFCGLVGFAVSDEVSVGVFEDKIVTRKYRGDVMRDWRTYNQSSSINGTVRVNKVISIVADPFAHENYLNIRFVEWMGKKLVAESVEPAYPRLEITVGGEYNGEQT